MVTGDEELMRKAITDRFKIVFLTKIKIIFNFFLIKIVSFVVVQSQSHVQLLRPHGLYSPSGKNNGVGCCFFLQGDLLDPRLEPTPPAWQADSLPLSHLGSS